MRTITQFLLWTDSSSSNEDYKTVSVLDTGSSTSNVAYKTFSVVDRQ
jgi:hypothetical protein